ncbi:MAG: endonuclease V [Nitrososphaeraceae archaeon]
MEKKPHSWAFDLQKEISTKIITYDTFDKIENICGIDVSYKSNVAYCSAVITNSTFDLIASVNRKYQVQYPYIAGLLFLRESGPLLNTLKLLKNDFGFDILLIDGHGILHPRKCGLASYLGYMIDKPTIGVAKNLLCGSVREDHFIEYDRSVLGYRIKKEGKKPIYVSIGHKISLTKAIQIVQKITKEEERIPEPLRVADINSKNNLNFT